MKQMMAHVTQAQTIMTLAVNDTVFSPKITLTPNYNPYSSFSNHGFVMPINKAQVKSLKVVVLGLRKTAISQRPFYGYCLRDSHPFILFIYAPEGKSKYIVCTAAIN